MSNRVKEEERIERIIRNLLKLPENRRCINCNSLGPQYVCTTFWTFVCTNCSGVHREFTHRVKSVSMAKFNAEEVTALQAGGNERARQIYFKEWDPQRHSFPDGSNQNRLRDFIKHAYVDRKFTGEWSTGKLAMVKSGAKEDSSEWRSIERHSPQRMNDDRSSKYYIEERRNPRPKQDNARYSGHRNRPVHFEVVDDRFRDDGSGSGRRSEILKPSNEEFRAESRSPTSQKRREKTSPPVLRPVSDILGENALRLQVGESPRANDRKDNESSGAGQKTASSCDPSSDDVKSVAPKRVNSVSLIDFSADPNPPDTVAEPQTQQTALTTESGNRAPDTSNVNSLESILFGLSAPAAGPGDIMSEAPSNSDAHSAAPVLLSSTATASTTNTPEPPSTGVASAASPVGMAPIQQNQSWTSSLVPYAQGSSSVSTEESSQPSPKVMQDTTSGVGSQTLPGEPKSFARNELPADLFTSSYSSFPAPVPSWQIRPPHGMGFSMQYRPVAVPLPALTNSGKSTNPFDLNDDTTEAQVPMFPSMLPVQVALPNSSAPTALLPTSNAHSSHLMGPQALPYASIAPSQLPSYGMPLSSVAGAFNVQQLPNNLPLYRPQTVQPVRRGEDAFSSLNPIQQPGSGYPAPSTTNSSSSTGGNPFG